MANKKKELKLSQNIEVVRNELKLLVNSPVIIEDRFSKGNKNVKGLLSAAYDNLFIVKFDDNDLYVNKTYTYYDLISGKIRISKES
ncbi:MAG: Veg family protein [Erysipelotrichaceae bacterium]